MLDLAALGWAHPRHHGHRNSGAPVITELPTSQVPSGNDLLPSSGDRLSRHAFTRRDHCAERAGQPPPSAPHCPGPAHLSVPARQENELFHVPAGRPGPGSSAPISSMGQPPLMNSTSHALTALSFSPTPPRPHTVSPGRTLTGRDPVTAEQISAYCQGASESTPRPKATTAMLTIKKPPSPEAFEISQHR